MLDSNGEENFKMTTKQKKENDRSDRYATIVEMRIPPGTVLAVGPIKKEFHTRHFMVTFAIGNDHTADLIVDEDAMKDAPELFAKLNNGIDLLTGE